MMRSRMIKAACVVAAIGLVGAAAYAINTPTPHTDQMLAPFKFEREAAATSDLAAQSLFLGIGTASPRDFVQHLLLGVCNNEVDVLQRFAESLHKTQFRHNDKALTYYELRDQQDDSGRRRPGYINRKKPVRIIASAPFDPTDPQVKALELEAVSTYWGERFVSVDVAGVGYDGLEYQTRIVVAQVGRGWYAMPRCRSSQSFYAIADAMALDAT